MKQFFAQHWGDLASSFGLVATVFAIWFAKSARTAAREARNSVQIYSVTEELNVAVSRIQDLGNFIQGEKWEVAALRAQDLITSWSTMIARRKEKLGERGLQELITAGVQLRSIHTKILEASSMPLTAQQLTRLNRTLQLVNEKISEQRGYALGKIDRSEA